MFDFANRSEHGNDTKYLADVLAAVGRAERTLAGGLRFAQEKYIRPLAELSPQWIDQADDGSPEFRLAASLAGMNPSKKGEVGPIRAYLEEVAVTKYVNWSPGSTSAVWSNRPPAANLAAVFRRRQMEAFRGGLAGVPLRSPRPARLDDVLAFLRDETDDEKLADLLWGMIGVDWAEVEPRKPDRSRDRPPVEFGLPRLLVNPLSLTPVGGRWRLAKEPTDHATTHDPDVFHALAAGRGEAVDRAARRLRAGGLNPTGHRNRQTALRSLAVVSPHLSPGRSDRLLAAMLFPLAARDLVRVANLVLHPPEIEE